MRKQSLVLFFLFWFSIPATLTAQSAVLRRFFPEPRLATPALRFALPTIPKAMTPLPIDVAAKNQAVGLNNQGISSLERQDINAAISFFSQACRTDPLRPAYLNNLLVALKKSNQRHEEVIQTAQKLLSLTPQDSFPAMSIAATLMEKLNRPLDAIPWFALATRIKPQDPQLQVALAMAFERAGYPDQAVEILKNYAYQIRDDPYPSYLLGRILLEREAYTEAISAFQAGLAADREGFVHDGYIRSCFYAGQLKGLAEVCRAALQRFPNIINRPSLERIYLSLSPQHITFSETVQASISDPESLKKLDFLIRFPPTIPDQQKVVFRKAELLSGNTVVSMPLSSMDEKGRYRFPVPSEAFSARLTLRLTYEIDTYPRLMSSLPPPRGPIKDLEEWRNDPLLSLNNPTLAALADGLLKLSGDYALNCFLAIGRGLHYSENGEVQSVEWALNHPDQCDCTEFSYLLAALFRRQNIPARVVTGFLLKPELRDTETEIGHAWTEGFFQNKGWIPFDATLGANMKLAYFGSRLSDQLLLESPENGRESRISVDFLSSRPLLETKISGSFTFSSGNRK